MDQTNEPLSGMDSTSFHADSTSMFSPSLAGGALPPLPSFQTPGNSATEPHAAIPQSAIPGQSSLLGRGSGSRSASPLDNFANKNAATQSIEFRVARADSPVRRLRLTGNRYTFGSAEGCSIRLNESSLRPMHAVLTRDGDRVVVRAYSVPIEVNRNRVNETTLAVGDQLRLGDYEFELLAISSSVPSGVSSSFSSATYDTAPVLNNPSSSQADRDEAVWRQRLRKEIDQWRSKQVECDRRASQCDEREAHLRGRESELWSRAENLYRREAKIQDQESAVYQMHDDYAERQQELLRLREDTNKKQRQFQQRESEFARQETEYRQQLEEATAHLLQSQAQATAATEAVKEMRQQFEALNEQIEELSNQQSDLKRNEETEREENQRQRSDLETQRDAAIDAQAESDARRREALDRVEQMSAELDRLRTEQAECGEVDDQRLRDNEATIDSLRKQVEGLQHDVDEASEEANRLRSDYRDALDSVRQLEDLVAQSNQRGDTDRAQWASDADSLRAEIESLSTDLENTREELDSLRQANQSLNTRLHEVETERDHAIEEVSDRPTREAFDHLRSELENANQTLADLRQGITKEVGDDNSASEVVDSVADDSVKASSLSVWELPEANAIDEAPAEEMLVEDQLVVEEEEEPSSVDASIEETPDDVWPTYQVTETPGPEIEPETETEPEQVSEEIEAESSLSVWDLESSDDQPEEMIENTGVWNPNPAEDAFSEIDQDTSEPAFESPKSSWESSIDESADDSVEAPVGDSVEAQLEGESDEPEVSIWNQATAEQEEEGERGSKTGLLASQLIADLGGSDESAEIATSNQVDEVENDEPISFDQEMDQTEDPVAEDLAGNDLAENDVAENYVKEEPIGLMSLLADDSVSDDSSEDVSGSPMTAEVAAWDREYAEESDSHSLIESASDSVWDVEASDEESQSDSDSFRDAYNQCEAEDEAVTPAASESEDDHSQDRVDVTAMMPSMEELEDEEPDDAGSYSSFKQPNEEIDAEPSSASALETSQEPVDSADATQQTGATQEIGATEETDDDSIEAYMNRLLGRVQGTPGADSKAPAESVSLSSVSVSPEAASEVEDESGSSPIAPQPEIDPDAPLVPRSHAPERNSDLSAMRDLANQSARTAISRSTRIQTRNMQMAGVMNFGVAVVAVLFGLGAAMLLTGGLLYLAWLMVVIIAVISIRDGLRNLSDARARMQAAERGELPQALEETLSTPDEQAANAEDRLALQNAAAKAAREQHAAE